MAEVNTILDQISSLPALPGIASKLVGMLNDDRLEIDEVHRVVRQDEAISVAVIRAANSVAFGTPGREYNLQQALTRLGMRKLVQIALQETTASTFQGFGDRYGMRRGTMWRSSLGGAMAAEMIAERTGVCDPSIAFLCGLLRDIGKIAIELHPAARDFARLVEAYNGSYFLDEEERCLGVTHATLGAALASRWTMPEVLLNAIQYHHSPPPPSDGEHDDIIDVVHAGDVIAMWAGLSDGADGLHYPLSQHVRERFFTSQLEVEALIAMTNSAVQEAVADLNESELRKARA